MNDQLRHPRVKPRPGLPGCGDPHIVEPAGWVCQCGAGPYATADDARPCDPLTGPYPAGWSTKDPV